MDFFIPHPCRQEQAYYGGRGFFHSRCIPEFLARGNKIKKDFFSISFFRAIRGWNTWAFPFYIASVCPHNGREKKNGKGKKDVGRHQFLRPIHIFYCFRLPKSTKKMFKHKICFTLHFCVFGNSRVGELYFLSNTQSAPPLPCTISKGEEEKMSPSHILSFPERRRRRMRD